MKKMMFVLLIVASSFSAVYAGDENVSPKVLDAFKTEFTGAKEVKWTRSAQYFKAAFSLNGQQIYAFYSLEGEFLALSRNLSIAQLPLHLMKGIQKKITNNYWLTDLFEMNNSDGTSYYGTVEDQDTIMVLKSSGGNDWTVFDRKKKA